MLVLEAAKSQRVPPMSVPLPIKSGRPPQSIKATSALRIFVYQRCEIY